MVRDTNAISHLGLWHESSRIPQQRHNVDMNTMRTFVRHTVGSTTNAMSWYHLLQTSLAQYACIRLKIERQP